MEVVGRVALPVDLLPGRQAALGAAGVPAAPRLASTRPAGSSQAAGSRPAPPAGAEAPGEPSPPARPYVTARVNIGIPGPFLLRPINEGLCYSGCVRPIQAPLLTRPAGTNLRERS